MGEVNGHIAIEGLGIGPALHAISVGQFFVHAKKASSSS
jgi:hypothetical protein